MGFRRALGLVGGLILLLAACGGKSAHGHGKDGSGDGAAGAAGARSSHSGGQTSGTGGKPAGGTGGKATGGTGAAAGSGGNATGAVSAGGAASGGDPGVAGTTSAAGGTRADGGSAGDAGSVNAGASATAGGSAGGGSTGPTTFALQNDTDGTIYVQVENRQWLVVLLDGTSIVLTAPCWCGQGDCPPYEPPEPAVVGIAPGERHSYDWDGYVAQWVGTCYERTVQTGRYEARFCYGASYLPIDLGDIVADPLCQTIGFELGDAEVVAHATEA